MSTPRWHRLWAVPLIAGLSLGPLSMEAQGGSRYAISKSPYWKVGTRDNDLSKACQRGRFNQIEHERVYISFEGDRGNGVLGVAQKGSNLRDPGHLAVAGKFYHFQNDGYSDCRVFVAG